MRPARLRERAQTARAAAAARVRIYTDLDALLRDGEVDVAVVCTPHHLHAPLSAQALEAGKHVFSEGPLAINLEQADRALDAWRRSGKQYTARYYSRYFRGARQAYRLARSGKLGQILMGRSDALWYHDQAYYDCDPWRGTRAAGDRVFVHQGRYAMDLFLWVMEDTLEEVFAYAGTRTHQIEVEDNAAVQLRFASGAYGQLLLSNSALAPGYHWAVERLEILGQRASIAGVLNYNTEECELVIGAPDRDYADELRSLAEAEPPMPADGATVHYEAFADAVRGGPPVLTAPESLRQQVELNRAIARSLAERAPVRLPLKRGDPFYGPMPGYDD